MLPNYYRGVLYWRRQGGRLPIGRSLPSCPTSTTCAHGRPVRLRSRLRESPFSGAAEGWRPCREAAGPFRMPPASPRRWATCLRPNTGARTCGSPRNSADRRARARSWRSVNRYRPSTGALVRLAGSFRSYRMRPSRAARVTTWPLMVDQSATSSGVYQRTSIGTRRPQSA